MRRSILMTYGYHCAGCVLRGIRIQLNCQQLAAERWRLLLIIYGMDCPNDVISAD